MQLIFQSLSVYWNTFLKVILFFVFFSSSKGTIRWLKTAIHKVVLFKHFFVQLIQTNTWIDCFLFKIKAKVMKLSHPLSLFILFIFYLHEKGKFVFSAFLSRTHALEIWCFNPIFFIFKEKIFMKKHYFIFCYLLKSWVFVEL